MDVKIYRPYFNTHRCDEFEFDCHRWKEKKIRGKTYTTSNWKCSVEPYCDQFDRLSWASKQKKKNHYNFYNRKNSISFHALYFFLCAFEMVFFVTAFRIIFLANAHSIHSQKIKKKKKLASSLYYLKSFQQLLFVTSFVAFQRSTCTLGTIRMNSLSFFLFTRCTE